MKTKPFYFVNYLIRVPTITIITKEEEKICRKDKRARVAWVRQLQRMYGAKDSNETL